MSSNSSSSVKRLVFSLAAILVKAPGGTGFLVAFEIELVGHVIHHHLRFFHRTAPVHPHPTADFRGHKRTVHVFSAQLERKKKELRIPSYCCTKQKLTHQPIIQPPNQSGSDIPGTSMMTYIPKRCASLVSCRKSSSVPRRWSRVVKSNCAYLSFRHARHATTTRLWLWAYDIGEHVW